MNKKQIFIYCLIFYLIIAFVSEIFYRNKLYNESVKYIEKIDQEGFFHYFYYFWSNIFLYGMIGIGLLIILFFYPFFIFFSYTSVVITLVFIMSLLKSLYSNPRPFWDIYLKRRNNNEKLPTPTECDGEFGNPSGHSLLSVFMLILWDLFINSKFFQKNLGIKKIIIKYAALIISIICMAFINYSRINRQIHSFNQILFGLILGIAVFFAFCYILEIRKMNENKFMKIIVKYKIILIPFLLVLFSISVILGLTRHNKKEKDYESILKDYCHYSKDEIFGKNTAYSSCLILIEIGAYLGILFLKYKINNNYPNNGNHFYNWNEGKFCQSLKIGIFTLILPSIFFIPVLFVKFQNYVIKFILTALLFFLFGFFSFGICFYYACIIFKKEETSIENDGLVNSENVLAMK